MGIHNFEKNYANARKRLDESTLSLRNKELILRFLDDLALENMSKVRLTKYCGLMKICALWLNKDLDKATKDDLKSIVSKIQLRDDYSVWTKKGYKVAIRKFYKWFLKADKIPEIVDFITITIRRSEKRLPSEGELLTEEEIQNLLEACQSLRDKAFIAMLYESGGRIGEIGNLFLRNLAFDKYGITVTLSGKTGSRKIRLIYCTPYVSNWVNNHPMKHDKNSPLWVTSDSTRRQVRYGTLNKMLKVIAKRAGIKKKVNPHSFRHSRATFMANHLTEFQMNQYFGWIQGSDMPSTYVHMSGKEVDNAVLQMNGIITEDTKNDSKLSPRVCPRCDTINTVDAKHCNKCGGILDLKYAMELEEEQARDLKQRTNSDDVMNQLLKNREVQEFLLSKLKELRCSSF
ncbi:MAG: tyrosine-type recombinase/integrase [Nanoarchaeota archaeon]|nr:tyrosine-type recombinase/integrase [Nanoarchaeota archaeon]MBU1643607.1 tyrosine-type recombinase/integrase [Nanoarchaeota archaeon]MBU1976614.1 tyrosine-type recombinase/integrase [Nanoarchaeota archaeon]